MSTYMQFTHIYTNLEDHTIFTDSFYAQIDFLHNNPSILISFSSEHVPNYYLLSAILAFSSFIYNFQTLKQAVLLIFNLMTYIT